MYRFFDIFFSLIGIVLSLPLLIIIYAISFFDTGSPIFAQERVGLNMKPFILFKFRTMSLDTINVASHLAPSQNITSFGRILRKTKLDELPQLLNVFNGDMSFVGPRPNLFNQDLLINHRKNLNIYRVKPGITGLAQINKIDMSQPRILAETDFIMIKNLSLKKYFMYIFKTLIGSGSGDVIK